jgi:hypothetical protein
VLESSVRRLPIALAVLAIGACPVRAQTPKAGELTLSGLQVRASLGNSPNSAAYLTITNAGDRPDTLLSVTCACAQMVMIHRSEAKGGLSTMTDAGAVVVPPKGKAVFAPDGLHLMLMGLKAPLKDGAKQAFTLRFEHAGEVKAEFQVKASIEPEKPPAVMPGMAH